MRHSIPIPGHRRRLIFSMVLLFVTSCYANGQILYDNGPIKATSIGMQPNFVIDGRSWDCFVVTYMFINGTNDIANNSERNGVRAAFDVWQNQSGLVFREVFDEGEADIRISWGTFDHGDPCAGCDFDGENGILAHAFFPPPNFGDFAGDLHFDDSETWTLNMRSNSDQPIDLITVAAHEIGHALGLEHTNIPNSLMNAFYDGSHRFLGQDDIDGIQEIYGPPISITGPSLVCSSNTTFTLQNRPPGTTVTWTRSSNLTQVSGQGTNDYVVRAGSSRGNGWVRATINGPCGQAVLPQRTVWVGPPNNPTNVYVPGYYGVNPITLVKESLYTFQTSTVAGASRYNWTLPSGFSFMSGQGTTGSSVKVWTPNTSGTFNLRSSPANGCGSSGYATLSINLPGSGGGGGPGPIPCPNPPCSVPIPHSFPNPANEELVIDFTGSDNTTQLTSNESNEVVTSENTDVQYFAEERNANAQTYSETPFLLPGTMKEVFLYNDKMMLMFHTTTAEDLLSLSTARLPEGIYILHTVVGEETFRQKIIISHK